MFSDREVLIWNITRLNVSTPEFLKALEHKQLENKQKGFGDDSEEWKKSKYNVTLNMLKKAKKEKEYIKWSTLRKFNK